MSFLYPAFLLGALAIALPVALHLLRRDVAPEVPFSAVRLLRRSPIERTRRRRLRDLLLLAARVVALSLLAAAFARPFVTTQAVVPLRIVAVDRSFSMGAPGAFSRAQEAASDAIAEASGEERVAVIAFDDRAEVVAAPGSAAEARSAVSAMRAGFGATRYGPAIARAVEIARGSPARLVVVSDLQRNGWENQEPVSVPSNLQLDVREAGAVPQNLAVVQVRAERERVLATVRNIGAPRATTVRVTVDGREVASSTVTLPADDTADVAVPLSVPERGALAFTIEDPSGYAADNIRHLALDPESRVRVMVITTAGAVESGLYFVRALDAADGPGFDVRAVTGAEVSRMSAGDAAAYSAVVVLSTRGLDRQGREVLGGYLRSGGGLFVAAGSDVEPSVLAAALGWPELAGARESETPAVALSVSDVRHPVFRPFGSFSANLGQVRFGRIWKLNSPGWEVAARFSDGSPALLDRRDAGWRALLFASDLDRRWNEFPAHPAFVPFAIESVRHVANLRDGSRDYVVADVPAGVPPVPGVHKGKDGRIATVNVDPRESAGTRLTSREFAEMVVSIAPGLSGDRQEALRAQTLEARQNLWQYGLVMMLVVLVAESAVGRARD